MLVYATSSLQEVAKTPPGQDLYTSYKSSEIDKWIPAKPDSDGCDVQLAVQHPAWHVPNILDQGL